MILAVITTLLVCMIVLWPMFFTKNHPLEPGATQNSPAVLRATKDALVKRYVQEESMYLDKKSMSAKEWRARSAFLKRRFIDAARRLDFLEQAAKTRQKEELRE